MKNIAYPKNTRKHTNGFYIGRYDIKDFDAVIEMKNDLWKKNCEFLGLNMTYRIVYRGPRVEIKNHRTGKIIRESFTRKENATEFDVYPVMKA